MRVALYYAPDPGSALGRLAAAWLGRDASSGAEMSRPAGLVPGGTDCDAVTASPRRYGFHATLKAPFRLAEGMSLDRLDGAVAAFAARRKAFELPLRVARLGRFLALVPAAASEELETLAAAAVVRFEPYRAPLGEAELARRRRSPLTPRQDELLARFGYPYVLDQFQFHMTLTEALQDDVRAALRAHLQAAFAAVLAVPQPIDRLALFVEDEPGAPFRVHSAHVLAGVRRGAALPGRVDA